MKKGDFVFYANPNQGEGRPNNLVTVVLDVMPERNTCIIWWPRTTALVPQEYCTVLPVDLRCPIMVPETPWFECCNNDLRGKRIDCPGVVPEDMFLCSPGNQAGFKVVPLEHFGYGLREEGKMVSLEKPGT